MMSTEIAPVRFTVSAPSVKFAKDSSAKIVEALQHGTTHVNMGHVRPRETFSSVSILMILVLVLLA